MPNPDGTLTPNEVATLVGDVEEATLAAIIAIGASAEELEEALAWANGEDDVMGELERPLAGNVALIYDLLTADEAFEEDR
jgi:hypothetical protein